MTSDLKNKKTQKNMPYLDSGDVKADTSLETCRQALLMFCPCLASEKQRASTTDSANNSLNQQTPS